MEENGLEVKKGMAGMDGGGKVKKLNELYKTGREGTIVN
jgi:hypothetical protein